MVVVDPECQNESFYLRSGSMTRFQEKILVISE